MLSLSDSTLNTLSTTLNAEKISKLNNLILESISTFNNKYKEINNGLMELKLEFLNHLNAVQSLLHNKDNEENIQKSQTPIQGNFQNTNLSSSLFENYEIKNIDDNLKFREKKNLGKFERIFERKKTYTYLPGKNFKLSSILFNKERRDDVGKKNVSFHPESVKEKKVNKKNENKNNQDFENKDNKENQNKDILDKDDKENQKKENIDKDNKENQKNEKIDKDNKDNQKKEKIDNEDKNNKSKDNNNNQEKENKNKDNKEIEMLSENLRNENNQKTGKKKLSELDLNSNNSNKEKEEDESFSSEESFSLKEEKNSDNNNKFKIDELNKTVFPSKTSQSGINFITKKKEELIYSDTSDLGKELCNLLYIILDLEDKFDSAKNLRDLFNYLFENFKVKGIKELFLKTIYNKVYIEEEISEGLFITFNQLIAQHLKEIKLLCQARNQPLCWIAMNILEFDRYFQMLFSKEKY